MMCTERVSPVASIFSTCLRTQPEALGMYVVSLKEISSGGGSRLETAVAWWLDGSVRDNSGVARRLPQVDAGVDRVPVDLGELLGGELQVLDGVEAVVELL